MIPQGQDDHAEICVVERRRGTTSRLHAPWPDETSRARRIVGICAPTAPKTLVIGSAQTGPLANPGVEIVKRSSGGGAVLIAPLAQVWVDVWLPRDDPLWDDDVVRSSWWLGRAWREALQELGVEDLHVHEGRLARTELSDLICFAGMGSGEVTWMGRKLVGMSQRRDRFGARFQSVSPVAPLGPALGEILQVDAGERRQIEWVLELETSCLLEATGQDDSISQIAPEVSRFIGLVEQSVVRAIRAAGH